MSQWIVDASLTRRKRLAESDITAILKCLRTLPITVDLPDADRVMQLPILSLKYQLTVCDAAYLEWRFA